MNRASDWRGQGERDLQAAETSAAAGYHEWCAFQAQQSAEKAVIAVHEWLGGPEREHSIPVLGL